MSSCCPWGSGRPGTLSWRPCGAQALAAHFLADTCRSAPHFLLHRLQWSQPSPADRGLRPAPCPPPRSPCTDSAAPPTAPGWARPAPSLCVCRGGGSSAGSTLLDEIAVLTQRWVPSVIVWPPGPADAHEGAASPTPGPPRPAAHRGLPDALPGLTRSVVSSTGCRWAGARPADDAHVHPHGLAGQLCRAGVRPRHPSLRRESGWWVRVSWPVVLFWATLRVQLGSRIFYQAVPRAHHTTELRRQPVSRPLLWPLPSKARERSSPDERRKRDVSGSSVPGPAPAPRMGLAHPTAQWGPGGLVRGGRGHRGLPP